jgi:hypothetical protein
VGNYHAVVADYNCMSAFPGLARRGLRQSVAALISGLRKTVH